MAESAGIGTEIRVELLTAALYALEEGIAVLDHESQVLLWNPAAAAIAGYLSAEMVSRPLPADFYEIEAQHPAMQGGEWENWIGRSGIDRPGIDRSKIDRTRIDRSRIGKSRVGGPRIDTSIDATSSERPVLVSLRHKQGHSLPAMLRRTTLRDGLGKRFGTLLRFHPVEEIDALPHGAADGDGPREKQVEESQAAMTDRLDEAWTEFTHSAVPFGLLWIGVDQAATLRKTHGRDASEAMLAVMERTLLHSLRPAETLGRWGVHEFLVVCHERTAEMLAEHGQHIAGLAPTADFRWWGDRVSLTLSIGAAQAVEEDSLHTLMVRAQQGMQESSYAGGNQVTLKKAGGTGGQECSQS